MKKSEGSRQKTYMYDPMTQTVVWGLLGEQGWVEAGKGGNSWDNCNSINNKMQFKK